MFTVKYIAPALFGIALSLTAVPGFAQSSSHQEHAASELALSLNAGEKWQGDDNMHKGMDAIRNALAGQLVEIHEDRLPTEGYEALAIEVINQTDFMIENCVLEPEVDAQFHVVLGQVIEGAYDMETGDQPHAGAVERVPAPHAYGGHCEHPGWQPLD